MCVSWLISMCTMTHIYEYHKSLTISVVLEIWLFLVSFPSCVPCLIPVCVMSHSYVSHDSLLRLSWLIPMCDVNHLYVYHDPHLCAPWLMNHQCRSRDMVSFKKKKSICMPGLIFVCVPHHSLTHIYVYNDSHLWVWRISYVCHDSHLSVECVMDQSFIDVISQQNKNMSIWKRKRNSSSAHVFTHTHSHTYTPTHTHTHTHMYTHSAYCKSIQNRTRIKPVKLLRILVPQEFSILLIPQNNSSKHCSKE